MTFLSLPGVLSGVTMVFIPSVSTFVISRLLGGGKSLLLGDLIEMQFMGTTYNPWLGSAIALVMMVIVLVCMAIMNRFGEGEEGCRSCETVPAHRQPLLYAAGLLFLYLPIFVLIVFSFNASKSRSVWSGFTLDWYKELFQNSMILDACGSHWRFPFWLQ